MPPADPASTPRRRAGRPTTAVVTREGITAAALTITETEGYESLTMARIAKLIGVRPSALYNHVGSKQDILHLLEDELMSRILTDDLPDLPWDKALEEWARRYREVFAEHTPLVVVVALLPITHAPRALTVYEAITCVLQRAGVPDAEIIPTIVAFESFIFGSAYDVNAPDDIFAIETPNDAPRFHALVSATMNESMSYQPDRAFELGLSALIESVRSRAAAGS